MSTIVADRRDNLDEDSNVDRRWTGILVVGLGGMILAAAAADHGRARGGGEAVLFDNLGTHEAPITTSSPRAQAFFNQGIRLCYAFNHEEAIRSFEAAAAEDGACAMAWWGTAFALGPNINAPMGEEAGRRAYAAARKAQSLAGGATAREQAYIAAIVRRYAEEPPADRGALDQAFADAMREVHRAHPDDLDAATIFAEALMDASPWSYWNEDGSPKPFTGELLETLEGVLRRDPDHPGANHLYIHAVEASPSPERGLGSAFRLGELAAGAGHLVHMPSHIYLRLGMYDDAAESNKEAVQADEDYLRLLTKKKLEIPPVYPAMYYSHNVHFLWYAQTMLGQSAESLKQARKTAQVIREYARHDMPMLEWMRAVPLADMLRFGRWDGILAEDAPPEEKLVETGIWRLARGVAYARRGDVESASESSRRLSELAEGAEASGLESPQFPGRSVLRIAARLLSAELAGAKGEADAQIEGLREAVKMQDKLPYMEPPYWYFPVRHYLGAALLDLNRCSEAEEVYRADLKRNPRNGWALFGLLQSLRRQGNPFAADVVQKEFDAAWRYADVALTASRF
jgi:tetratricopeptide (TPR) repeat protein